VCGQQVGRYVRFTLLSLALWPSAVLAEGATHMGTAEQQRACRIDVLRHCRGVRDDLAIADCLKANARQLHPACQRIIESAIR
jgi:hypothetical protein